MREAERRWEVERAAVEAGGDGSGGGVGVLGKDQVAGGAGVGQKSDVDERKEGQYAKEDESSVVVDGEHGALKTMSSSGA